MASRTTVTEGEGVKALGEGEQSKRGEGEHGA